MFLGYKNFFRPFDADSAGAPPPRAGVGRGARFLMTILFTRDTRSRGS